MYHVATIILILAMLGLVALTLRLSVSMARRAICNVVGIFKKQDAVRPENAKTLEELGLAQQPVFGFRFLRDYKPYAFQFLVQSGVIQPWLDNWFYLSEEALGQARGIECRS